MCVTAWGESKGMTRTVLRLTFGRDENIFFFRASVSKTRWGSWSFMSTSILSLAIQPPSLFSTHFGGVYERCFIGLEQSLVYIYSDSGNLDIGHKKPTTFVAKASTFVIHGINLSMASDCWLIFGIGHDNWQHANRMPTRSSCSQANLVEFSSETYQCMWGDSSDYKPPRFATLGKKLSDTFRSIASNWICCITWLLLFLLTSKNSVQCSMFDSAANRFCVRDGCADCFR